METDPDMALLPSDEDALIIRRLRVSELPQPLYVARCHFRRQFNTGIDSQQAIFSFSVSFQRETKFAFSWRKGLDRLTCGITSGSAERHFAIRSKDTENEKIAWNSAFRVSRQSCTRIFQLDRLLVKERKASSARWSSEGKIIQPLRYTGF